MERTRESSIRRAILSGIISINEPMRDKAVEDFVKGYCHRLEPKRTEIAKQLNWLNVKGIIIYNKGWDVI